MRTLGCVVLLVAAVGLVGSAVEWEEVTTTATSVLDQDGRPTVVFSVHLRYDVAPSSASLSYGWTVREGSGPSGTVVLDFYRPTTFPGGGLNLYLGSGHVEIEAGKTYSAHVTVDDERNDLHFERDIGFAAPVSLPVGIRLTAQSGDAVFDLSGVPDEEIEELATAFDVLDGDYELLDVDVSLDAFFDDYASEDDDFPTAVFLIPAAGLEGTLGPTSGPITITVQPVLYVFTIPVRGDVRSFLEQVAVYEREFVGRVFEGSGDEATYGALTVFVGDDAWAWMEAAAEEEGRR